MLNRATLCGRLVADPDIRATKNGVVVANFRIAVDRDYVDKATGEREADFVNITAWRGLAQLVATYFRKGSRIMIDGRLESSKYEKDGVKYERIQVIADSIYFVDLKPKALAAQDEESLAEQESFEAMEPPDADGGDLPVEA